jgi:sulfite reductase alpha subunit-like flavoprotein
MGFSQPQPTRAAGPMIMVGIAPFRAFLQKRRAIGAPKKIGPSSLTME